jgi:hypothetical protein
MRPGPILGHPRPTLQQTIARGPPRARPKRILVAASSPFGQCFNRLRLGRIFLMIPSGEEIHELSINFRASLYHPFFAIRLRVAGESKLLRSLSFQAIVNFLIQYVAARNGTLQSSFNEQLSIGCLACGL